MGKASKWFRGLLGFKKSEPSRSPAQKPPPAKKRWSFAKSNKEKDHRKSPSGGATGGGDDDEASRHALAVAAATAAVAEAAVAAAQAAAAVVKLTSGGGFNSVAGVSQSLTCYGSREERAAVMIQSHFRSYLSRKALRALKALVQLQALVRGQLLRKQYMDKLRQIVWAQARARAGRALVSEVALSSAKSSPLNYTERLDHTIQARNLKQEQQMMLKRNGSKSNGNIAYDSEKSHLIRHRTDRRVGERSSEQGSFTRIIHTDDERSDKILEVDTWKPHQHVAPKRRSIFHSPHLSQSSDQHCQTFSMSSAHQTTGLSPSSSSEVQSVSLLKFALDVDGNAFSTAENSPQYYSASSMGGGSSRRAPFTPTRSDGSRSCLSGYSDHPSYMAYTESSKAKVRSVSAPKQRPQYERSNSTNRYSVYAYSDSRPNYTQKASTLNGNFANRAYPGSGRLDRLGMPVVSGGLSGGHWHRY